MTRARAVAIVGPTAAGKSALALSLAERFELPILACDSVQVYRGLDIGSAKPSADERRRVRHELIDVVDPDHVFSAGEYARLARAQLERGPAIVCGGTGLYLRAAGWTHSGLDPDDEPDPGARNPDHGPDHGPERGRDPSRDHGAARSAFEQRWMAREQHDAGAIHRALRERDPETAAGIHPHNVVRALRGLWLCELYQEPVSAVRRRDPPRPLVELLLIIVDPGVAAVDANIDRRCEAMLTRGWLAEVEKLVAAGYDARHLAMRSLGYRELLDHLAGHSTLDQASEAIKSATRKYARRQRTFFRHQFRGLLPMDRIVHIDQPDACLTDRDPLDPLVTRVREFLS